MLRQINAPQPNADVLVGSGTNDDAGVYKLTNEIAMIQSVDYFTPIVDDPYDFGQIAAANALSDIYAMGGEVKTGLNIVGYPIKKLGPELLAQILQGAQDKMTEAGGDIIGGHSIDDQEPKFGMAVTGVAHPEKIYQNSTAQQGDAVVLTKPIGVGIHTTAIKRDLLEDVEKERVTKTMAALNKAASELLAGYRVHAVTDVTGFGLLGHSYEMAAGSGVSIHLSYHRVPQLKRTIELAGKGVIPGGSKANHAWLDGQVHYHEELTEVQQLILCDAITSGGLLISMPIEDAESYVEAFNRIGDMKASIIGEVKKAEDKRIVVHP
ncbi:selenide, water dikinase [Thalassobacillus devorans]|uniref:Selenide, water dikinase n=1 Tax=Thalassobacillus devorans TaxID=279813 RepID=A0ABQ1P264_9BACI|nr:selenide,water dikinase [Thalassobacillus devorans]GGC88860.1 selenide, water dikinase [Thalassobacillus devorans]